MSSFNQNFEEILEEELAKIDPAVLQALEQYLAKNLPAVQKIVQKVLDEPIPQETEKRLHKPLIPESFIPKTTSPAKKGERGEKKRRTSERV